jgi:hypothetical protein
MDKGKHYLVGVFDDEDLLLHGVSKVRGSGVKIEEVYTPFPVHGLDEALGYKRSRLPIAAFLFGLCGTLFALWMQYWMSGFDWPMNVGGKPYTPLPTFIPVTFELTVLIASLGMVATFLIVSDLKPFGEPKIFDLRSTDDKHIMAIDLASNSKYSITQLESVLKDAGASEINKKDFE